ncbi:hypothetical protein NIES4071_102340 (plasmid) [Calothrix sp. NIES-4071]|nr:hypothetical protein NIES4071_102340 [Calothrix sp. NIES-4071]BAZ64615.1 hypothetical protein NIES4105_103480 [Calothrix sp. NIES-4105]
MLDITFLAASSTDILQNAANGSQQIAQGFDQLWQQTLNGNLYSALIKVARLFALATLLFYMVELAKNWMNQEDQKALSSWIWPIIVISLMVNDGALIKTATLSARNYINVINNDILQETAAGASLETAYNSAIGETTLKKEIGSALERCRSLGTSKDAADCLTEQKQKLQAKAAEFYRNQQISQGGQDALSVLDNVANGIMSVINDPVGAVGSGIGSVWDAAMGGVGEVVTSLVTVLLLALNNAYQWCIEFALLLTALLGPMAVGASLLPYGQKAIFAWLSSIMGVGVAKLSFNIICGLCGQLVSNAQANQPMIFLLFVGLLSPLLATALGAGGGMATMGAVAKGGELAARAGAAVATSGASEVKAGMARAAASKAASKTASTAAKKA